MILITVHRRERVAACANRAHARGFNHSGARRVPDVGQYEWITCNVQLAQLLGLRGNVVRTGFCLLGHGARSSSSMVEHPTRPREKQRGAPRAVIDENPGEPAAGRSRSMDPV